MYSVFPAYQLSNLYVKGYLNKKILAKQQEGNRGNHLFFTGSSPEGIGAHTTS